VGASKLPIRPEFRLMNGCPFKNLSAYRAGQFSLENQDRIDTNLCAFIRPFDVEMGWEVIAIKHQDLDAFMQIVGMSPQVLLYKGLKNMVKLSQAKLENAASI
jgi:hypothetical protein